MNLKDLILVLFVVVTFLFAISNAQNETSLCNEKNKRRIALKFTRLWVLGDRVRKFPETLEQLPKFCNDSKKYLKDIRDYNDECIERYSKQLLSVLFYRIHEFLRDLCGNDPEKVKQLFQVEAFTCANSAYKVLRRCNVKFIDDLEAIPSVKVNRNRWPTFCCAYEVKLKCYVKKAENVENCQNGIINSTVQYHESIARPIIHSLCAQFLKDPKIDEKCDQLITRRRKSYKLVKKNRSKSMYFPFVNAIESIH